MNKNFLYIMSLTALMLMGHVGLNHLNAFNLEQAHMSCVHGQGCGGFQGVKNWRGEDLFTICQQKGCQEACLNAEKFCKDPYNDPPAYCDVCYSR